MGFVYEKKSDRDPTSSRWWVCVYLPGGGQFRTSLRLTAPGNRRVADKREKALQYEVQSGTLSPDTIAWMGDKTTAKLRALLVPGGVGFKTWTEAAEAYLGEVKTHLVSQDARLLNTYKRRSYNVRRGSLLAFAAWAGAKKLPLSGDYSRYAADFVRDEGERGLAPVTLHGGHIPFLMLFGDWLHEKKVSALPPNRKTIRAASKRPPKAGPVVPDHATDLAVLRSMHARRLLNQATWVAWCLVATVRGLGCRPSEALTLNWNSVDLDGGRVKFEDTKEWRRRGGAGRLSPVLWAWVDEALREMHARAGSPESGPVCPNNHGKFWGEHSSATRALQVGLPDAASGDWKLKGAQKLAIMQMLRSGWPGHVVARWTGHTLSVQERHYVDELTYMPEQLDFAEFGTLSECGRKSLAQMRGNTAG